MRPLMLSEIVKYDPTTNRWFGRSPIFNLAIYFSFSIYGYISALSNQPGFEPYPLKYPIVVFIMVLSILLWFFPMSVAHRLIPKTKYENILNIQSQEAVRVACIVFALLIFTVQVLPAIAYYLPLFFIFHANISPPWITSSFIT